MQGDACKCHGTILQYYKEKKNSAPFFRSFSWENETLRVTKWSGSEAAVVGVEAWRAVAAPFGTQGSSNEAGFADGFVIVKITEVLCGACGHGDLVFKQGSPWPQRWYNLNRKEILVLNHERLRDACDHGDLVFNEVLLGLSADFIKNCYFVDKSSLPIRWPPLLRLPLQLNAGQWPWI